MLTLAAAELQRLGLAEAGVDQYFSDRAAAEGRTLLALETVDQQLSFLAGLGAGQEDEFVAYSLAQMRLLPELMSALKHAWRSGNAGALERIALEPLAADFPSAFHTLITARNLRWKDRIDELLDTAETEFVLVGAAHLVGELGLPALLRGVGYDVRAMR